MLQKISRRVRRGLDAFFVVNIHVQIGAVLLRERNAFIVDEGGMLDRCDAGADCVLDAFGRMRMRFDTQPEVGSLLDGSTQLFGSELDGLRIAAVCEHRTGGQNLDVIGAAMRQVTDLLPHFPRAVGHAEAQIQRQLNIRRQAGHRTGAPGDGDIRARHVHARTDDDPFRDGVAHRHVVECPVDAHIAHCGKTRQQGNAGIGDGKEGRFCRRPLQNIQGFGVGEIRQMSMAVDEPGQHGHLR